MERLKIINNERLLIGIVAVLVILLIFVIIFNIKYVKSEKGYSVEVIRIDGCEDCFNLDVISLNLDKTENIKIKSERALDYKSDDAKRLSEKYGIKKIPALIILSKDLEKISLDYEIFRKENKAAIFDRAVPYLEISTGSIRGVVNLKEIFDSSCKDCASPSNIQKQLEGLGIKVGNYEKVDYLSTEGQQLITENNIDFLPVLFISKDIEEYWWTFPEIKNFLTAGGEYYFFKEPIAPYKEISTKKIKGKVEINYITNKSCEDCFNATLLKDVFGGIGIYISSERYVDVNNAEGRDLLKIYNITAIPTAVLSREINDYNSIKEVLEQVGTFEEDGTYIFRKLDILKVKYQKI